MNPLVSVIVPLYNAAPYIRAALEGFLAQKTNFPFEVLVHDDASTDGSAAIIREYAEKYPDIIKPIYETENQWGKGTISKSMDAVMHPNSKYIATCEGDDYWTDPQKLQIQVDFLETHPDYYMSCHAFSFFYDNTKTFQARPFIEDLPLSVFNGREYCTPTLDNFIYSRWFTQTLTIVRRNEPYIEEAKFKKYKGAYDYITNYYMMKAGKCALFKDVMGIYRRHQGGIYTGRNSTKWRELSLANYYTLYQLEKDKRILIFCNSLYYYIFMDYIKEKRYRDLVKLVKKHFLIVPIDGMIVNTLRAVVKSILGMKP